MTKEQAINRLTRIQEMLYREDAEAVGMAIESLQVIPSAEPYKGMTNGEVLQSLFPNIIAKVNELLGEQGTVFFEDTDDVIIFPLDWWNSPYKGEQP